MPDRSCIRSCCLIPCKLYRMTIDRILFELIIPKGKGRPLAPVSPTVVRNEFFFFFGNGRVPTEFFFQVSWTTVARKISFLWFFDFFYNNFYDNNFSAILFRWKLKKFPSIYNIYTVHNGTGFVISYESIYLRGVKTTKMAINL